MYTSQLSQLLAYFIPVSTADLASLGLERGTQTLIVCAAAKEREHRKKVPGGALLAVT